jgi:hypothetical protein
MRWMLNANRDMENPKFAQKPDRETAKKKITSKTGFRRADNIKTNINAL